MTQTWKHAIDTSDSRGALNAMLAILHERRHESRAWGEFWAALTRRSLHHATTHPMAAAQITAIHAVIAAVSHTRTPWWSLTSWGLAIMHLGMLEDRSTIGVANTLTLVRANLPLLDARLGRALPFVALATDFLDGKLSRHWGTVTAFGRGADVIADVAFWTWYILEHDRRPWLIAATITAWMVPVLGVSVTSFATGRMVDIPRYRWFRPAATLQILLSVRAACHFWRGRAARCH